MAKKKARRERASFGEEEPPHKRESFDDEQISGIYHAMDQADRGIVDGTLERIVPRTRYVVVYCVDVGDEDELVVLRVYHAAQDRSSDED
jgi:plasmid stabilization system protein ParE